MMKFSNISSLGRQVLRSVLLVAGVSLASMAIGCGGAATDATIDESAPAEDPTSVGTGATDDLDAGAASTPEASTPEAAETPGE